MDPAYQLDETFAWFLPGKKGDHDLKFGASYYYLPLHVFDADNQNGTFGFSASDRGLQRRATRAPIPTGFTIRVPGVSDFFVKGTDIGVFAQDKWKVNNRFTVSLGLRYDVEVVPMDNTGNFLFSDPADSPVDKNNISPRVGATWALDDAGTTVVRGGWGLYYQKTPYSNFTPIVSSGVVLRLVHGDLPGQQRRSRSVGGPPADRSVPRQRSGRESRAAEPAFPAGTTTKNTGTVRFDNPDRHLPYAHQASVGFEKQLAGRIAVSADYVHASHRDLYMLQDLNPGMRATTARTATVTRIMPTSEFTASVLELVNVGWSTTTALQISLQKRFSNRYQFRVSYTYSRGRRHRRRTRHHRDDQTYTTDPVTKATDLNLDDREALDEQDRPHVLSINGSVEVPHTKGLNLSGVWQYNSGTPFTLTDSTTDPNRNGIFEEPLPAGTYSGAASNPDAITVENNGGFNGARGPDFSW